MNNSSLLTADPMTHLKIVVVSLLCATLVAGVGLAGRMTDHAASVEATVVKATKPVTAATRQDRAIR
jgi:hypothetical protein